MWIFYWIRGYIERVRALRDAASYPDMSVYNSYKATEREKQATVLLKIEQVSAAIRKALPYMPKDIQEKMFNDLNIYKDNLPIYCENVRPIYVPQWRANAQHVNRSGRRWGRRWRRRYYTWGWVSEINRYDFTVNNNFSQQIAAYIQKVSAMETDIPTYIYNYCPNENSLVNTEGLQSCGINPIIQAFRDKIQIYKTQSNNVMEKLQNTEIFPQFQQALSVNNYINYAYNWYPMDQRSSYNNGYASLTQKQIKETIKLWEARIPTLYDMCVSKDTHCGLDTNEIPICVNDDYLKAAERCGQAIQMSKTYEYGTDKLEKLWTDVSNSIPGNMVRQSSLILNTSNDSCKKWVDMFNVWEEMEREALAEPCVPERPITSTNDPVLIKLADDWNKSASEHIRQLRIRLEKIQKYIKKYPNIIDINKNNVTLAPHSMPATAIIKNDFSESKDGEGPMQHLEMIIPNGKPGESGNIGVTGIIGEKGQSGKRGPEGNIGNNYVPSFYNIFNPIQNK